MILSFDYKLEVFSLWWASVFISRWTKSFVSMVKRFHGAMNERDFRRIFLLLLLRQSVSMIFYGWFRCELRFCLFCLFFFGGGGFCWFFIFQQNVIVGFDRHSARPTATQTVCGGANRRCTPFGRPSSATADRGGIVGARLDWLDFVSRCFSFSFLLFFSLLIHSLPSPIRPVAECCPPRTFFFFFFFFFLFLRLHLFHLLRMILLLAFLF